jgi:hypothetical protein
MGLLGRDKPYAFIDLSHGRIGVWKSTYPNMTNNTYTIEFRESNKPTNTKIHNVKPLSWINIDKSYLDTKWGGYVILLAGEYGAAPMGYENFSDKGYVVELIKKINEMQDSMKIATAVHGYNKKMLEIGDNERLKGIADNIKTVSEAEQKSYYPGGIPGKRRF